MHDKIRAVSPQPPGDDAAVFATSGVPTAMIFVRNAHGCRNRDEAKELADFGQAPRLLVAAGDALHGAG